MKPYSSRDSCSPTRKSRRKSKSGGAAQTCFSYQSLARIARRYNEANPQDKINIYRNRDRLWRAIRDKIPRCQNERCWTRASWLPVSDRDKVLEDFKPPIPQGKYAWLNTDDIDRVLKGYERVFPLFVYLGTYPMDFQEKHPKLFNPLNVSALRKAGKEFAGLVLNLDNSDEPGSHWVAVLIDIKNRIFEFFDSYGENPTKEIMDLYHQLDQRARNGWKLRVNKTEHQQKNSECGVYSIHFIVRRISGTPFKQATEQVIRDAKMNQMRSYYFDPHSPYNNHI